MEIINSEIKNGRQHRSILRKIAHKVMIKRGLVPDFSAKVLTQLKKIQFPAAQNDGTVRDLRHLVWCSIDNDDSLDLDQLTAAIANPDGSTSILVAISDVDAIVKKWSAIDNHAQQNTTSVYTIAETFPMLPEKLSTELTSLNYGSDRLAIVVEMALDKDGLFIGSDIYRALVKNKAKLSYNSIGDWLEGKRPMPQVISKVSGLEENLMLQNSVAQKLKSFRNQHGALDLETIEVRPVFSEDELIDLEIDKKNYAKEIIEEFMIAANIIVVKYLELKKFPSFSRVVRKPKNWDRIIELAEEQGTTLTREPDAKALQKFLMKSREADPLRFPDLSLSVIKLLGQGEYVIQFPRSSSAGHFGLALKDYTHSTAPNRRYPDLITQRLLKAAMAGGPLPYKNKELEGLARQCTEKEDAAKKVERQVAKSAAALLLEKRIGEQFDAIVTGVSAQNTWVRLTQPPIEGRLESGFEGLKVGQRVIVKLVSTDAERGFIDFEKIIH